MKKIITTILAIALMAVPTIAIADPETMVEFDQRIEKQVAEWQKKLPMVHKENDFPFSMNVTSIEKNGKVIATTMETKGEFGWIAMAENMGGVEKFKAFMQRDFARDALFVSGLELARGYTLRWKLVDNGKEVCTIDVNALIISSMIGIYNLDDLPGYTPEPLPMDLVQKSIEYEEYLKEGGYPPAMTTEERHKILEFIKYNKD